MQEGTSCCVRDGAAEYDGDVLRITLFVPACMRTGPPEEEAQARHNSLMTGQAGPSSSYHAARASASGGGTPATHLAHYADTGSSTALRCISLARTGSLTDTSPSPRQSSLRVAASRARCGGLGARTWAGPQGLCVAEWARGLCSFHNACVHAEVSPRPRYFVSNFCAWPGLLVPRVPCIRAYYSTFYCTYAHSVTGGTYCAGYDHRCPPRTGHAGTRRFWAPPMQVREDCGCCRLFSHASTTLPPRFRVRHSHAQATHAPSPTSAGCYRISMTSLLPLHCRPSPSCSAATPLILTMASR